ncbi:MAG: PEGA domain-containing protein, partial [Acidobacteria bacterium]|nr:PEGA domain-containing protein [Acidobacteriota bacterium]
VPGDMAPVAGASREALALVFGRALHADPGRRYESSVAFVDDLARIADQSDVTARPEPGGARARRRSVARADVPLPLEAFPAQSDPALPLNLESAPSCPIDEFAPEADDADKVLAFDEPMSPVAAASRMVGGPEDRSDARRVRAWVAGAAGAGLVIGLAAGYVMWGRSGGSAAVGVLPAAVDSASEPVVIEDPEPLTSPGTPSREPGAGDETPPAAAASGNLLIRSTPAGATVFVDGDRRGITPVTLPAVPLGTRVVRVQQDGFVADERRLTLTADRPSRSVEVRLRRAPVPARPASSEAAAPAAVAAFAARTGSLLIESRPPGAAVAVDGRPAGSTPLTLDSIPAGRHTVTMRLAGFRPVTATVRVEADERARVAASLTSGQEP